MPVRIPVTPDAGGGDGGGGDGAGVGGRKRSSSGVWS
jgi:hypothetical protein